MRPFREFFCFSFDSGRFSTYGFDWEQFIVYKKRALRGESGKCGEQERMTSETRRGGGLVMGSRWTGRSSEPTRRLRTERLGFRSVRRGHVAYGVERRGVVAVEAALCLPLVMLLLFGLWEVGRIAHVNQLLVNAAREGARVACGGSDGGTPATVTVVETAVRNYMTGSGLPTAAVNGAVISIENKSANAWVNPSDAKPSDAFSLTVTIPAGTAYDSLASSWGFVNRVTHPEQMQVSVSWQSARDATVVVNTTLPY